MSQSNILNHNREIFNLNVSTSDYWDFHLYLNQSSGIINNDDCLGAYIDTTDEQCYIDNGLMSKNDYQWDKAVNNGVILNNIGLTGVDNGLILYDKNIISDEEFKDILENSTLEIDKDDNRLYLFQVNGNNQIFDYSTTKVVDDGENVMKLSGGWYQGFFQTGNGCDYKVLPSKLENDGWEMQFILKPENKVFSTTKPTLNDIYPENKGIFFYIGTRAENKWYKYYNDKNEDTSLTFTNVVDNNGVQEDIKQDIKNDIIKFKTDNKFIFYNRTKDGVTTKTKNPPENIDIIMDKYRVSDSENYFILMNRTKSGYTTKNISNYETTHPISHYDLVKDLIDNALSFQIKEDGSVGYKYLVRNCESENEYEILNEWSYPNLINLGEWVTIDVRFRPIENKFMRLMFYINGKLVLYSKELPILNLRQLDDIYEKQEGVPYNISIGGGTQGLCDVVYDDKDKIPETVLFLEKEFGGSFIGLFKSFKFFTCDKNYNDINENLK